MPGSAVAVFKDPNTFGPAFRAATRRTDPTARGAWRAEIARIDLQRLWMQPLGASLPQVAHGNMLPGRAAAMFPKRWCALFDRVQQERRARCRVAILAVGWCHYPGLPRGMRMHASSLPPATFAPVDTGDDPPPARQSAGNPAAQRGNRASGILACPEAARTVAQSLMEASMIDPADPEPRDEAARPHLPARRVMARIQEHLITRADAPVYMPELRHAIGVAERTLRLHCKKSLGMSLQAYLRQRRMHLAHRALIEADGHTTVTDIATRYGFGELGRFAVHYRTLFGRSPSETLREKPKPAASQAAAGAPRPPAWAPGD
jgi:AraC-like DNA-binding protein